MFSLDAGSTNNPKVRNRCDRPDSRDRGARPVSIQRSGHSHGEQSKHSVLSGPDSSLVIYPCCCCCCCSGIKPTADASALRSGAAPAASCMTASPLPSPSTGSTAPPPSIFPSSCPSPPSPACCCCCCCCSWRLLFASLFFCCALALRSRCLRVHRSMSSPLTTECAGEPPPLTPLSAGLRSPVRSGSNCSRSLCRSDAGARPPPPPPPPPPCRPRPARPPPPRPLPRPRLRLRSPRARPCPLPAAAAPLFLAGVGRSGGGEGGLLRAVVLALLVHGGLPEHAAHALLHAAVALPLVDLGHIQPLPAVAVGRGRGPRAGWRVGEDVRGGVVGRLWLPRLLRRAQC